MISPVQIRYTEYGAQVPRDGRTTCFDFIAARYEVVARPVPPLVTIGAFGLAASTRPHGRNP